ncbi:MAG: peptide ABC transporter substrate-binding protein [Gammaproteobacteria bacterium]
MARFIVCLKGVLARLSVVAVVLMLTACERPKATDGQVLHRGNGGEPGTLNPLLADDVHAFRVLSDLYEGLVTIDVQGNTVPGVARSWEQSEDGLLWRFKLRESARWSDGSRVVADDFVRSVQRLASGDFDSPYEALLAPIDNFTAINLGKAVPASLGVRAASDDVVEFRLTQPTPYWPSILTLAIALPTPPSDDLYNGAYQLVEARVNDVMRLRKNDAYWDAPNVAIDEVVYHSIEDPLVEYNRFVTGDLHITMNVPVDSMQQLQVERPDELRIAPSLGLYYLAFDLTEAPTDQPDVRQALTMSIDRRELTAFLGRGEQPAYGIVPNGMLGYTPARYEWRDQPMQDRQQRARRLLSNAGFDKEAPLSVTLVYDTGYLHEHVALLVKDFWEQLGSVQVSLEKREWQYFLATRDQREQWDSMRFAWIGDYNDPSTFLDIFLTGNEQNLPGYGSAKYDELLSGAAILSGEDRAHMLEEAERTLINDYAVAPLYFYTSKHLVHPRVSGFEPNLIDRHLSKYLVLAD